MSSKGIKFKNRNNEYIYPCPFYPIGSIYISMNSTNPSTYFGGEWEQIKDRFLLACGNSYQNGTTGGEAEHTLIASELPNHEHLFRNNAGNYIMPTVDLGSTTTWGATYQESGGYKINSSSGQRMNGTYGKAHNNMPPYLAVYVWRRVS